MLILAISDFHGAIEILEAATSKFKEIKPNLIVFTGDIVKGKARGDEWLSAKDEGRVPNRNLTSIKEEEKEDIQLYFKFYEFLDNLGFPTVTIPGNMDAPAERYFRIIMESEAVYKNIVSVHGRHIRIGRNFVVGGFGGEISEKDREDFFVQIYPKWEAKYQLSNMVEEKHDKILAFHMPPIDKVDLDHKQHIGSPVVNELIDSLAPKFAFCGHAHRCQGEDTIGDTLVINPGALKYGNYAIVDTQKRRAEFLTL